MIFEKAYFIKPFGVFKKEFSDENPSSLFFQSFTLDELPKTARLYICTLGVGYAYINGQRVSKDLFTAPPSDYEKRLWYMCYDVSSLLKQGKNTIVFLCGNGFLNEDMENVWDTTDASWRDFPKVIAELHIDDGVALATDDTWKATLESPYRMNRYRQGVVYDSRIPAPDAPNFSSCGWRNAVKDERAPKGVLTEYTAEPIRELLVKQPVSVVQKSKNRIIVDFGENMSGYARIFAEGNRGDVIKMRYGETLTEKGELYAEGVMHERYFTQGEFATEYFICNGQPLTWSTLFSYYGFRYVEVTCDNLSALKNICAVFVSQDIATRSGFDCSNSFLNKLFTCGIQATKSNLFYMPTDCPTREKYGWMNDAQSSSEQILTNFHAENMFLQWNVNICDALKEDKGLPGIVPTYGWGYDWGNGPVSDGSLFEHAYRVYLHSGNKDGLAYSLPYFRKYLAFLKGKEDGDGFIRFGLYDWANPNDNACTTPLEFINAVYRVKFNRIARFTARLLGEDDTEFIEEEDRQIALIRKTWILPNGACSVQEQTALAMLIYHGIYEDLQPLKEQLKQAVERRDFHHNCGMVGLRHLYMALNICGLQEYAMRIVTAKGYPSYSEWLEKDATTLWEMWDCKLSRNHHMYSDVLSWMMKTIIGISPNDNAATFEQIEIKPYFFKGLDFARGYYDSPKGKVFVAWERLQNAILLRIDAPEGKFVFYNNQFLLKGTTEFILNINN